MSSLNTDSSTSLQRHSFPAGWSFGAAVLRSPGSMGALAPSSAVLADAMAREVPAADRVVVELGGGTGSITAGLVRSGISLDRLITIERDARLCRHLQERFPKLTVLHGDALELASLLRKADTKTPVGAVVSSIPMLNMELGDRFRLLAQACSLTGSGGPMIQFSYGAFCPVPAVYLSRLGMCASRRAWVLRNIPPASVWRIDKRMQRSPT